MTAAEKQLHRQLSSRRTSSFADLLARPHRIALGVIVLLVVSYVFVLNSNLGDRYALKNLNQQAVSLEQQQNEMRRNLDSARSLSAINTAGGDAGLVEVTSVKYLRLVGEQKLVAQR